MNKEKNLTISEQYIHFKKKFPNWKFVNEKDNKLTAIGTIQPSLKMSIYEVKIVYTFKKQPVVYIISPPLCRNFKNDKIPHIYSDKKPCLYYPKYKEWTPNKYLANTVVVWLSLWLYFYESWHITGVWSGEGIEHNI